jgi:biotin synthase
MIRLSAGRRELGEAVQALCYFAGANSIFYGERLLTTGNPDVAADRALFDKLGLAPLANEADASESDLAA